MALAEKEVKFVAIARRSDKVILASRIHTADKSYVSWTSWPGRCHAAWLERQCPVARPHTQDFVSNVNKVLSSPGWASVTTDKVRACATNGVDAVPTQLFASPARQLSLDDGPNMFYVLIDDVGCLRWGDKLGATNLAVPLVALVQAGRVYVAITSKGYPSRFIYGSTDGQTRGILQGAHDTGGQTWRSCARYRDQRSPRTPQYSDRAKEGHSRALWRPISQCGSWRFAGQGQLFPQISVR